MIWVGLAVIAVVFLMRAYMEASLWWERHHAPSPWWIAWTRRENDKMDTTEQPPAFGGHTWADIERAALHCPFLHAAVTVVAAGKLTREQVLIELALAMSHSHRVVKQALADELAAKPARWPR